MDKKRYKVYIAIFVVTTIIASCIAVYLGIIGNKNKKELQEIEKELAAKNDTTKEKQETNTEVKEVEKIVEVEKGVIPKFDPSKMKNKQDNISYEGDIKYGAMIQDLGIDIDSKGVVELTSFQNNIKLGQIKVNGLQGKVIDACKGTLGNGSIDAILFLTENGDVYWANDVSFFVYSQGNETLNVKKIESVSNICRIVWTTSYKNNTFNRYTFIGIDTNGNCYDLWYEYLGR